jgi:ATP-binding cassette subfamily F protein 3
MIDIKDLSIQFTGDNLFENVNTRIHFNDKIALVGSNGKGKSTLLRLLCDLEKPETGQIIKQKGIRLGYLQQEFLDFKGKTIFEEVKSSLYEIQSLIEHENEILNELSSSSLDEETRIELVEELGVLNHKKEELNFYSAESRIQKVLLGLGFKEKDFNRNTEEFSGGWQMRIQLAKILLAENDLLLLDEPTNHLDIDTLEWLINFLKNYEGALIVVSHDRYFVNSVTNKTLEIFGKSINFFPGNYDKYLRFKDERENQIIEIQKNRDKKIKETEKFIERFRYKNTKARQVQSRVKMLEKLEAVELVENEKKINIQFPDPPRSGIIPIELINISKNYDSALALDCVNVKIERGEKIAVLGPNGAGKSTLVKILGSKINPSSGQIILGSNTTVSYFEQEVVNILNSEHDLIDALEDVNNEIPIGQLRKILGSFLFSGDDVFKKIKVLSGGEKSRIALARLLLTKSNFIILDEPTNHLDFTSKEVLQKALLNFPGTIIIVSHDIDFLKPIVNKVFEMREGQLKIFYGNIDYYLTKRNELTSINTDKEIIVSEVVTKKDQKRIEAEKRQNKYILTKDLKKNLFECEKIIQELEELKIALEQQLADSKIYSDKQASRQINIEYLATKKMLEVEYDNWTELTNKLETIERNFQN